MTKNINGQQESSVPSMGGKEMLENIILSTVDIPSLPPIAQRVLQLVDNDTSSVGQLEDLIYKDQSFSTRLLRIANSPYYGKRQSIETISDAIMLIGFGTLKSLVIGASLRDLHRRFGPVEKRLWEHSLGVSLASSMLARETRLIKAEEALVAGLVHDVGKTVINNNVPDYYAGIIEGANAYKVRCHEAEQKAFGFNHCDVGGYIARKWQFPSDLVVAIECHHAAVPPSGLEPKHEGLWRIVSIADAIALHLGFGFQEAVDLTALDLAVVGITDEQLPLLLETLRGAYAEQQLLGDA